MMNVVSEMFDGRGAEVCALAAEQYQHELPWFINQSGETEAILEMILTEMHGE